MIGDTMASAFVSPPLSFLFLAPSGGACHGRM